MTPGPAVLAVPAPGHLPLWSPVLSVPEGFTMSTEGLSAGRPGHGLLQTPCSICPHCTSLGSPEADWERRAQVQVVDMEMMPESTGEVVGRVRQGREPSQ